MKSSATPTVIACSIAILCLPPAPLVAQTIDTDPPDGGAASAPDGYRWGTFLVRPEVALSLVHDSNIFATRTDEVDDSLLLLTPSVTLDSQWERHRVGLAAGAATARYRDADSEDYADYWADAEGRYDLGPTANVFGGIGHSREHEDRSSPDAAAGAEPTVYTSDRAHAGAAHSRGRFSARVGGTFERLDYEDAAPIDNDDRDRNQTGIGARLSYRLNPRYVVFAQAVGDARRYERARDDNGRDRDSDGNRAALGFTGVFSNRLSGSAHIGRLTQRYDDAAFSDVNALDVNGRLSFRATPKTQLTASLERSLEETTLADAAGYLYTVASLEATRRIDARLRATAAVSAAEADYQGIAREDDIYSAELGLRYMLSPQIYVAASYRVMTRDSNQREALLNGADVRELDDYARQQFFVTLGTLLYPVTDTGAFQAASLDRLTPAPIDWRGLFVGGQLAHGSSGIQGNGLRGGSGTDQGEYADEGAGAGVFAGYGRSFGRWYAGIEAEADRAATDIYHRKDKADSRTLNIAREASYALSLRGGYTLAGGDLLYARLGRVRTGFDSYYTLNDAPQNAVDATFEQDGTRYGVGTDIAAGRNLFVRLDYSHTDYDDFVADLVTTAENMQPAESYFRLGLGWQFGGNEAPALPAVALRGFYAGALLGHGSLNSHATGLHNDSGASADFIGDFGHNAGVSGGAFAGWGTNWQRWYGGVEATAEASTAEWSHVRDPNGRNFSVEQHDTHGLGVRAGYQVRSGALLYVRADRVRTRFNSDWSKGGNPDNDVDRDDRVHGTRIGLGADIPATRALFVRLDYSHTEYDGYGFTTEHGNPDTVRFDNSDTLFRLGVGARF